MKNSLVIYIISCLWCWGVLVPLKGVPLWALLSEGQESTVTNTINHATFNGSSYLRADNVSVSGLGFNTTKVGSFSAWLKFSNDDPVSIFTLSRDASTTFQVVRRSAADGNVIRFRGFNSSATEVLDLRSTAAVTASSGWTHVHARWNTNDATGNSNLVYINGVAGQTRVINVDSSICYAETGNTRITVGADNNNTPGLVFTGAIGELWFDDVYTGINSTDFYSGGNSVALGANGELPNGTPPPIYFSSAGSGIGWNDNTGGTNELTLTGSLGTDLNPPTFP